MKTVCGRSRRRAGAALVTLIAGVVACAAGAGAQDFYKGKTITIVVGSGAGGGFDINSRMLARHIGRHIPGRPDVIVSNMPGAGGLTAIRHIENAAARDGTQIVQFNFGLIGMSRLAPAKAPVDFRKLAWLGSISEDITICYTFHTLGIKTMADLKARKSVHFGVSGAGSNDDINARILRSVFGVAVKQVQGYTSSAQQRLAIERGELDGGCGSWNSLPEGWAEKVNPVYRTGPASADMPPGLPLVGDIAPGPREAAIIRFLIAHNELGRPFALHPDVPADRLALLRAAFDKAMHDPELAADAARLKMPVTPRTAAAAMTVLDGIYSAPEDIVAAARKLIED